MPKIPGINHQDAVRALEKAGFRIVREGKHIVMSDGVRIPTIPRHHPATAYTMAGSSAMPAFPWRNSGDSRNGCRADGIESNWPTAMWQRILRLHPPIEAREYGSPM